MKVLCQDLIGFMEQMAPKKHAELWDNVGLLLGSNSKEVKKILLCLDVTSSVVDEACKLGVDLIISHHPVIFKKLDRILYDDLKGDILYNLIKSDISVYSAHTNLDVSCRGVNVILAKKFGLTNIMKLKENINLYKNEVYFGLGAVGELEKPQKLEDFIEEVKERLTAKNVRVVGTVENNIKRIAVFCGSFDDDLDSLKKNDIDVLITGDLKYHTAIDAVGRNMCIIDAGHFNTEKVILPEMANEIMKEFPGIEVICNSVEFDPFTTY